jgi:hypothetical protein
MIWDGPFFAGRFEQRDHAIGVFEEHNAAVRREVPAERLLVIEPGDGWQPLCEFLGLAVPDEPYPHLNDPARFWGRVEARMAESRAAAVQAAQAQATAGRAAQARTCAAQAAEGAQATPAGHGAPGTEAAEAGDR